MDFALVRQHHLDARRHLKSWVQILKRRMFFSTQASSRTPLLAPILLTSSPAVASSPGDHPRPAACAKGYIISGKDRSTSGNFSPPLAACAISFPLFFSSFVPSGLPPYIYSPALLLPPRLPLPPSPPPSPLTSPFSPLPSSDPSFVPHSCPRPPSCPRRDLFL